MLRVVISSTPLSNTQVSIAMLPLIPLVWGLGVSQVLNLGRLQSLHFKDKFQEDSRTFSSHLDFFFFSLKYSFNPLLTCQSREHTETPHPQDSSHSVCQTVLGAGSKFVHSELFFFLIIIDLKKTKTIHLLSPSLIQRQFLWTYEMNR